MKKIGAVINAESGGRIHAWQFYDYNDVTAERPQRTRTGYWQDARHFNFEAGNMMLAGMYGGSQGKPFLAQPLDMDYDEFLRRREDYLKLHPEFLKSMIR